ncbi:MAG: hypothetical protein LBQ49_01790 [Rickettsiales bacterium]|nr:hypothetical protein [Rickettsiales bacterium]
MKDFIANARQVLIFGEAVEYAASYERILTHFVGDLRLTHRHFAALSALGEEGAHLLNRLLSEYRRKVRYAQIYAQKSFNN